MRCGETARTVPAQHREGSKHMFPDQLRNVYQAPTVFQQQEHGPFLQLLEEGQKTTPGDQGRLGAGEPGGWASASGRTVGETQEGCPEERPPAHESWWH